MSSATRGGEVRRRIAGPPADRRHLLDRAPEHVTGGAVRFFCVQRDVSAGESVARTSLTAATARPSGQTTVSSPVAVRQVPTPCSIRDQSCRRTGSCRRARPHTGFAGRPRTSLGRPGLRDTAVLEDHEPVGERRRFDRVVRDEHAWAAERREHPSEQRPELGLGLGVHRCERLVEEQQPGFAASARARATRWRSPPLSVRGRAAGSTAGARSASAAPARARAAGGPRPRRAAGTRRSRAR